MYCLLVTQPLPPSLIDPCLGSMLYYASHFRFERLREVHLSNQNNSDSSTVLYESIFFEHVLIKECKVLCYVTF
jgi:hypothetical protein